LQEAGAAIVDTDAIARSLTLAGGVAMPAIRQQFGADFIAPDGALDRDRMRAVAFSDPLARQRLEAILHPLITAQALA
ncbi:dephospho-CoA kinase, partial [Klebsiella pneumoniae]|uniref:dephospho-CoA kinase n=1 Tax=Klebsiella pneumoniae TaxID=573 RepID=UPI00273217F7